MIKHKPESLIEIRRKNVEKQENEKRINSLETENAELAAMLLETDYRMLLLENNLTDLNQN